jgi:hypothetical protein
MSKGPRLLLFVLIMGTGAAFVGIVLTVLSNWFFRGEAGLSRDAIVRMVVLGFVIGAMPVGLMWARSRNDKR